MRRLTEKQGAGSYRRCGRSGVAGCRRKAELWVEVDGVRRKVCRMHHQKFLVYGDPDIVKRVRGK